MGQRGASGLGFPSATTVYCLLSLFYYMPACWGGFSMPYGLLSTSCYFLAMILLGSGQDPAPLLHFLHALPTFHHALLTLYSL